jgi:glycerophosphoryl diester phosphodiesterase
MPLIMGHRGAMGQFPEHSYGGYTSAYSEGVDFLEIDIQVTKDRQLIMSHDPCLKDTSDIENHPEFADRKGTFIIGRKYSPDYKDDWLIHDFTLAEIKTLRKKQRFDYRNPMMNDIW